MLRYLNNIIALVSLLSFAAAYMIFFLSRAHGHGMTSTDRAAVIGFVLLGVVTGVLLFVLVRKKP